MIRTEREELLRRYLEGQMSLEQEHDFFIQVALDKELRHELKAHQTIEKAFQKDRVVDPSRYASLQATVASMVAATHPTESVGANAAPTVARTAGRSVRRMIMGGIGGLGILAAFLIYSLVGTTEDLQMEPTQAIESVERSVPLAPLGVSEQDESGNTDEPGNTQATPNIAVEAVESEEVAYRTPNRITRNAQDRIATHRTRPQEEVQPDRLTISSLSIGPTPELSSAHVHPPLAPDTIQHHNALDNEVADTLSVGVRLRWKSE